MVAAVGDRARATGCLFHLRSPLTEPPSVIDVADTHADASARASRDNSPLRGISARKKGGCNHSQKPCDVSCAKPVLDVCLRRMSRRDSRRNSISKQHGSY